MKMLPLLLINVALVGGGLVIYDQLRSDAPSATYHTGGVDPVQVSDLESRIARLEQSSGAPMLRTGGTEALVQRLESLEQRLARVPPPPRPDGPPAADDPRPPLERPEMAATGDPAAQPSEDELRWFRRMREADEQARREERERQQLATMLSSLEINLDEQQMDKLVVAQRKMRDQMGDIWRNVRRGPDVDREQVRQEMTQKMDSIREEFSVTINKFIPAADAAKIVETTTRTGRGFVGGPGGATMRGNR